MRLLTNKFVYTRKCNEMLANYCHLNTSPRSKTELQLSKPANPKVIRILTF